MGTDITRYSPALSNSVAAYHQGRVLRIRRSDLDAYLETVRLEPGTLKHLYPPDSEDIEGEGDLK